MTTTMTAPINADDSGKITLEKSDDDFERLMDEDEDEDRTLFVGDLPADVEMQTISELFAGYGSILSIQSKAIRTTKFPFSYAFVKFEKSEQATEAFEKCFGHLSLGGQPLRLGWARKNRRLHVGNCTYFVIISPLVLYFFKTLVLFCFVVNDDVTEDDLTRIFDVFGALCEDGVVLFKNENSGKHFS